MYVNINNDLKIPHFSIDSIFDGKTALAARVSTIMYTPWYFYGFKFALLGSLQCGIISQKNQSFFTNPVYSGIGLSLIIKNDNLIFPSFSINAYFYPRTFSGVPWAQFQFIQNPQIHLPDFNVDKPGIETIAN
jgi:hypothetical protein